MSKPNTKGTLLTLFFTVFIDLLGVGIIIPVLAPLFLDPRVGIFEPTETPAHRLLMLGLLTATFPLAQFFGAPILGALADRHGRKKLLTISMTGTLIGYFLFALGIVENSLLILFLSRALDGFTGGNISIAMSSIADISDEKSKPRNFGLIGMAFGLGFIIGPYIGGKLADPSIVSWFSYTTPFYFAALLSFISILMMIFLYKETLHEKIQRTVSFTSGFVNIGKALLTPRLRTIFIVSFFLTFGFSFFTTFFQVFMVQKFSYNQSQIGDMFAYIGLFIALTQGGLVRPVSKRATPSQMMIFAIPLLAIALIALMIPDKSWILYFIMPFIAIGQGFISTGTSTITSSLADASKQGEILGIGQSVNSLAQAIPPIVAGVIVSIDKHLPTLVAGGCTILAGIIFWFGFVNRAAKKE